MKKTLLALATLVLVGCASTPNPAIEQMRREDAQRQAARAAAVAAKDSLRMPDGSTYGQKAAHLYGYIAMLLRTCDVRPATQSAITMNISRAEVRLATSAEQKEALTGNQSFKPWMEAGMQDVAGRTVDCNFVRSRIMHWWDWTERLADVSRYDSEASKELLTTLESEVISALAHSPKAN